MPYQPYLGPVVALIAGILILIQPSLLSIIVSGATGPGVGKPGKTPPDEEKKER